jgi:hypothetical protein
MRQSLCNRRPARRLASGPGPGGSRSSLQVRRPRRLLGKKVGRATHTRTCKLARRPETINNKQGPDPPTHPPERPPHGVSLCQVTMPSSTWVASGVAVALLASSPQATQAFTWRSNAAQSRVRGRTQGLVRAVAPAAATSEAPKAVSSTGVWAPDSWRARTPHQMPVYDDPVSPHYSSECVLWCQQRVAYASTALRQVEQAEVEAALSRCSPLVFAGECRQLHEHLGGSSHAHAGFI